MKKLMALVGLILIAGCVENQQSDNSGIKFSNDSWVQRIYVRCIEDMQENCHPEVGMTMQQVKELRTLETGNCSAKLDWKHSDGYEQWSEQIFHLRITRIYTFRYGRLKEWLDIPQ